MKRIISSLLLVVFSLPFYGLDLHAANNLSYSEAYKGIVKIYLFSLDEDGFLQRTSSGSGIIISSSGLVLTNHHVVSEIESFDGSERDVAYQICLTEDDNTVPNCKYTAKFVASNEEIDIALLKIKPIDGLGTLTTFPYLSMSDSSIPNGEKITALGYPGIGGETITVTEGVASGKITEDGYDWIKTDTLISFGNSGGAGINQDGKIIGITTKGKGEIGYLLDIAGVREWINSNISKPAQDSPIENKVIGFSKIEHSFLQNNVFTSINPAISLKKPSDWEFSYNSENIISATDDDSYESGGVQLEFLKFPYTITQDFVTRVFELNNIENFVLLDIIKNEEIVLNNKSGRLITYSIQGEVYKEYYIPHGNHVVVINFDYGENDSDMEKVKTLLDTIEFKDYPNNFETLGFYQNDKLGFSLNLDNGLWVSQKLHSISIPVAFYNNAYKNIYGAIEISKLNQNEKELSNNELYKLSVDESLSLNPSLSTLGVELQIVDGKSYTSIGKKINNAIMLEMTLKNSKGASMHSLSYTIIHAGYKYTLTCNQVGESGNFEQAKVDFLKFFESFELNSYEPVSINEDIIIHKKSTNPNATSSSSTEILNENSNKNESPSDNQLSQDKTAKKETIKNKAMHARLKGKIILKVKDSGKAYYIHPTNGEMYYLGKPQDAFAVMRSQGVGIKNSDLEKIPLGLDNQSGPDTDRDGLSDLFEDAVGTDKSKKDTDSDGHDDKSEILSGYSPKGNNAVKYDLGFSERHKGKIFLQIEGKGEAWYINPNNGKRYFLGRPSDAFNAMRSLGLGISNSDFEKMME